MCCKEQTVSRGDSPPSYAFPPVHSVVAVLLLIVMVWTNFPALDTPVSHEIFTRRVFPELLSLRALAAIRIIFAAWVFGNSLFAMHSSWDQQTNYLGKSCLQKSLITFSGIYTQLQFSGMSWNLWGASCALSGYLALCGDSSSAALATLGLFLFETAAPSVLLVTFCVSHLIWPKLLKAKISTSDLKRPAALFVHNTNIIMVLTEIALLGGLPLHVQHFSLSALFGVTYILFSWCMQNSWPSTTPLSGNTTERQKSPQFIYFFLDTTLGWTTTYLIGMLTAIMLVFHFSSCLVQYFLSHYLDATGSESNLVVVHVGFVTVCCLALCRVRD